MVRTTIGGEGDAPALLKWMMLLDDFSDDDAPVSLAAQISPVADDDMPRRVPMGDIDGPFMLIAAEMPIARACGGDREASAKAARVVPVSSGGGIG